MVDAPTKRDSYDVKYVSSVVDVICSGGRRRRARAKPGGLCFRSLCFQNVAKTHVLAFAPSNRD